MFHVNHVVGVSRPGALGYPLAGDRAEMCSMVGIVTAATMTEELSGSVKSAWLREPKNN